MSLSLERDITVWCLHYLLLTMSSSTDSSPLLAASSTNSSPLLETNDTTINKSTIKSKYHSTKSNYHALGEYCMVIVWSSCIYLYVWHSVEWYIRYGCIYLISCVYFICARCVLCHCDTNELTIISFLSINPQYREQTWICPILSNWIIQWSWSR